MVISETTVHYQVSMQLTNCATQKHEFPFPLLEYLRTSTYKAYRLTCHGLHLNLGGSWFRTCMQSPIHMVSHDILWESPSSISLCWGCNLSQYILKKAMHPENFHPENSHQGSSHPYNLSRTTSASSNPAVQFTLHQCPLLATPSSPPSPPPSQTIYFPKFHIIPR